MPDYFSYIAALDSPGFFWDQVPNEKFRAGNLLRPRIVSQTYPSLDFSYPFVEKCAKDGVFEGRQLDWGAWAIILYKSDIVAL